MVYKNEHRVAVLLATYNGQRFLEQQLESLLSQTFEDFTVYVSDDGSSDGTVELIEQYETQNPAKVVCVNKGGRIGGSAANFLYLVESVNSELYMFCDQDDVWKADKIAKTVERYDLIEDKTEPILVHSDLSVADENLNIIDEFESHYSKRSKELHWKNYLIGSNVFGCTALLNKVLIDLYKRNSLKLDRNAILMHDYFFARVASLVGKIYFVDEPLMLYRQHNDNVVGARRVSHSLGFFMGKLRKVKKSTDALKNEQMQIPYILQLDCMKKLDAKTLRILQEWSRLYKRSRVYRVFFALKNRILYNDWAKNAFLFLKLVLEDKG